MKISKVIFFIFLALVLVFSIWNMYQTQTISSYIFAFVPLLAFVTIFASSELGVLWGLGLKSKLVSIENSVKQVANRQTELKEITTQLLKISLILTEGAGYFDGIPKPFQNAIGEKFYSLSSYLPQNFKDDINKEILILNEKTDKMA